jgi:hypothetical protein
MNIISFEKPICFINSSQKKIFEDYIEKYDYILTIEISKDNNLFSTITNNDTINLVIDADMLKDSFKNTKLNNLNEECLMNGIDKTYDIFNKRILEILSIKLFGNANYKVVLDNKNNEYINDIFIENIILNLNKYNNELINIINNETKIYNNDNDINLLINNLNFIFPFIFTGKFLELDESLFELFETSNYGGSKIKDGMYNIPLLLEIKRKDINS